jgi:hypothetical protein
MTPASFRPIFFDTLHELTELAECKLGEDDVVWNVEYLARGRKWYQFTGHRVRDVAVATGHSFNATTGRITEIDAKMLTGALLDFQDNAMIAAYFGDRRAPTQIAADTRKGLQSAPEIVNVSVKREQALECGSQMISSTSFVFVGFERAEDGEDIGSGKGLAASVDAVSPHWCRARTRLLPGAASRPARS